MLAALCTLGFVLASPSFAIGPRLEPPFPPGVAIHSLPEEKGQGYELWLSQEMTRRLHKLLVENVDEQQIAETLQGRTEDLRIRLAILLARRNVTQFKKDLEQHNNPLGVIVTVTGPRWWDVATLQRPEEERERVRERLRTVRSLLPRRVRGPFDAATTAPLRIAVRPQPPAW
ncbi:MAG TPA: hypothetical protein PKD86_12480 [Gemmatales bacterium]|nr:hypothetical protein [Gemmatales bacterium]HMP60158.1 hypothetical protein [Gemmatales bacterium]